MSKKIAISVGILFLFAGAALAGPVSIPNSFEPNTPALAEEVNANFTALADAVNDNDARLGPIGDNVLFAGSAAELEAALALSAANPDDAMVIKLAPGEHRLSAPITLSGKVVVEGWGKQHTRLVHPLTPTDVPMVTIAHFNAEIRDMEILSAGHAFDCPVSGRLHLRGVDLTVDPSDGVPAAGSRGFTSNGCYFILYDTEVRIVDGPNPIGAEIDTGGFKMYGGSLTVSGGNDPIGVSAIGGAVTLFDSEVATYADSGTNTAVRLNGATGFANLETRVARLHAPNGDAIYSTGNGNIDLAMTRFRGAINAVGGAQNFNCHANYDGLDFSGVACP